MIVWVALGLSILGAGALLFMYRAGKRQAILTASESLIARLRADNGKIILYAAEIDKINEENKALKSKVHGVVNSTASIVELLDEANGTQSSTSTEGSDT